jgi:hypothetical protein
MLAAGRLIVTIPRYLQRYRVRADSLLRTMSDVQNQVMREELFRNHRPLIEKFGPELAAQTEHRLMQSLARQKEAVSSAATSEVLQVLRHRISLRLAGSMGTWSRKTKIAPERRRSSDEASDSLSRIPACRLSSRRDRHLCSAYRPCDG